MVVRHREGPRWRLKWRAKREKKLERKNLKEKKKTSNAPHPPDSRFQESFFFESSLAASGSLLLFCVLISGSLPEVRANWLQRSSSSRKKSLTRAVAFEKTRGRRFD